MEGLTHFIQWECLTHDRMDAMTRDEFDHRSKILWAPHSGPEQRELAPEKFSVWNFGGIPTCRSEEHDATARGREIDEVGKPVTCSAVDNNVKRTVAFAKF